MSSQREVVLIQNGLTSLQSSPEARSGSELDSTPEKASKKKRRGSKDRKQTSRTRGGEAESPLRPPGDKKRRRRRDSSPPPSADSAEGSGSEERWRAHKTKT